MKIVILAVAALAVILFALPVNAEINSTNYILTAYDINSGGTDSGSASYALVTDVSPFSDTVNTTNTFVCVGFLCMDIDVPAAEAFISFLLNFNISGIASDEPFVDTQGIGFYRPTDVTKYFGCVQDASIASTPTFGIVHSGDTLNYINLSNETTTYGIRVSQLVSGNSFLLPATTGGCTSIGNKLPMSFLVPFVGTGEVVDAIELFLAYPFLDFVGDYDRTGKFTLILEKNQSRQVVVDVL